MTKHAHSGTVNSLMTLGVSLTRAFVLSHVAKGARVLEVGCGGGALAKSLLDDGFDVVAIDASDDAVTAARKHGVMAIQNDFFALPLPAAESDATKYDAIVFSRSLHHVLPLDAALERAKALLKPDGKLIVDEFGCELIDAPTAVWFYGLVNVLQSMGPCNHAGASYTSGDFGSESALNQWRHQYLEKHRIASFSDMRAATLLHFSMVVEEKIPYLFRYFDEDTAPTAEETVQKIYEWETSLSGMGAIATLGTRWVASPKA